MLEKMRKKLTGWKANSLSFAGRVTLAQSTLSSILGYIIQATQIPPSVCEEEKTCRDFIWRSTVDKRKCHLVAWEKICRPKQQGGLGFSNLRLLNKAHIMKLGWQLLANRNKLSVRIMWTKYGCGLQTVPSIKHRSNSELLLGVLLWMYGRRF